MSHKCESVNTSVVDSVEQSVIAKLRRLKIQESLCLSNINKISLKENGENLDLPMFYSSQLKDFNNRIKSEFSEINTMFEDIKAQTEEKLSSHDIENMKKEVIKLDEKLRTFKNYLQFELASLVAKEEDLNKRVNEAEDLKQTTLFRSFKPKKRIKPFNNIVPSPVKVLIKSPFKCKEVQQFQDFMKNSPNRYGGWNEYHHNTFIQVWQKHFNADTENICANDAFQTELLQKISGATREDISRHQEWYSKYLYLKEQQQNALNKWKSSKRRLEKTQYKYQGDQNKCFDGKRPYNTNLLNETENTLAIKRSFLDLVSTDSAEAGEIGTRLLRGMEFPNDDLRIHEQISNETSINRTERSPKNIPCIRKKSTLNDILKPTKQWFNRCNSSPDVMNEIYNIDCVTKLCTPVWRLVLKN